MPREAADNFGAKKFSELVTSDAFCWRVQQLARFTMNRAMEGAFAVYAPRPGQLEPVLSEVLEPSREELQEAVGSGYGPILETLTAINPRNGSGLQVNMMPLLVDQAQRLRRDVTMEVHSHTDGTRYFHPSLTDLEYHVEHSLLNPGLISGILVVDGAARQASLLAYRFADHKNMQPNYLEQLESSRSSHRVFSAMASAGIHQTRLDYSLRSGRLQSDPAQAARYLHYGTNKR